jgi:hypothetical protein
MRSGAFRRDVATEAGKRMAGTTPEERVLQALRLGERCLDLFLATLPPGTQREEARRRAQRLKGFGRRRSEHLAT